MSAVLLAPAVVLLSATLADADPTVLSVATATGLLAALVRYRPAGHRLTRLGGRLALAYLDCYAAGMDRLWQGGRP